MARKPKRRKTIPEVDVHIRVTRVFEAVCPECSEVVKDSIEGHHSIVGIHICDNCGEEFKMIVTQSKKDGRGTVQNKEVARNNILREIRRDGPISAKGLRERVGLCRVATKSILDDLGEEKLIKRESKGWVSTE